MRHLAYAFVPGAPRAASKRYRLFLTLFLTLIAIAPTNASSTWTSRATSQDWRGITSSSDGTKLAAVAGFQLGRRRLLSGGDGNIWTSTDSGATWTEITSTGDAKYWYGITSSCDGTKLAATVEDGNIWTSGSDGTDSCSTSSWLTPIVFAAFVVAGVVVLVLSIIACAWCRKCCCFKGKVKPAQPAVVMTQPAYVMPK